MKRAATKTDLTAEYVRSLFDYNPESGLLTHKKRFGVVEGARAGCVNSGYRRVKIHQIPYLEHRIIWLWMTGFWPECDTDHEDLVKTNNKWKNLREATRSQNVFNGRVRKSRKYGSLKGTGLQESGKWFARTRENGKEIYLGQFDTEIEAHHAYMKAAKRIAGEFARAA